MAYGDKKAIAFAGMKADSGDNRVESFAAASSMAAGRVVTANYTDDTVTLGGAVAGAGTGITVHTWIKPSGYNPKDCVGVLVDGVVWAEVKPLENPVVGAAAKFDAATGMITGATGNVLKGSVVRKVVVGAFGIRIAEIQVTTPQAFK